MHYIETEYFKTQFPREDIAKCLAFVKQLRDKGIEYTHIFID